MSKSIQESVIQTVRAHFPQADEITLETKFADLGADSLDQIEIIIELEDDLGISLDENLVDEIETVGQLVEYITPLV